MTTETEQSGSLHQPARPRGVREARMMTLEAALARDDAWKCEHCGSINGNHNQLCSDCRRWPSAQLTHPAVTCTELVGDVSGAPECHIQGWDAMPDETKAAIAQMMWTLKRALDSGWRPEPRRSPSDKFSDRRKEMPDGR